MATAELSQSNIMKLFSSTMQNAILMTESMTGFDLYQAFSVTTKLQFQIVELLTQLSIASTSESAISSTKNNYFVSSHGTMGDTSLPEASSNHSQSLFDQLNFLRNSLINTNKNTINQKSEYSESGSTINPLFAKNPLLTQVQSLARPSCSAQQSWTPTAPPRVSPAPSSNIMRPSFQAVNKLSPTHALSIHANDNFLDLYHSGERYAADHSKIHTPSAPKASLSQSNSSVHSSFQKLSQSEDLSKLTENLSANQRHMSGIPSSSKEVISERSDSDKTEEFIEIFDDEDDKGEGGRRQRTSLSYYQVGLLKKAFIQNKYPNAEFVKELSNQTRLSPRVIKVWFQNQRSKMRRYFQRENNTHQSSNENSSDTNQYADKTATGAPTHPNVPTSLSSVFSHMNESPLFQRDPSINEESSTINSHARYDLTPKMSMSEPGSFN